MSKLLARIGYLVSRAEKYLPLGGVGPFLSGPDHLRTFQRRTRQLYWRNKPWRMLRWPLTITTHALWLGIFLAKGRLRPIGSDTCKMRARIAWDVAVGGKTPGEARLHLLGFPDQSRSIIPQRTASTALRLLGSPASKSLLNDKLRMGNLMQERGIPTPPTLVELASLSDLRTFLASRSETDDLFAKARRGSGGKDALRLPSGRLDLPTLAALADILRRDSILVQPFIQSSSQFAAISNVPPVLRVTTFRPVNGEPIILDSYLSVFAPDRPAADWRSGAVRFPIDPRSGMLLPGCWFAQPKERFEALPWNELHMAGRQMDRFDQACEASLKAAEIVPDLPLVGWDIIPGESGPLLLEGNWGLHWLLSHLWHIESGQHPVSTRALLDWG